MKNLTLILILFCLTASAQIPVDQPLYDFTATDINGNTHHLQDYLDDGKTVILDFFCTWCGPCWAYHSTEAFADLYEAYGPEGSDQIVVLMIECDPSTNMNDLKGLTANSQGDWISATPYPIIDDYTIQFEYPVDGYPTWIKICPDGSQFSLMGPASNPDVHEHFTNQFSGCANDLAAVANHAGIKADAVRICEGSGTNNVPFTIRNYGSNNMESFTVAVKEDGNSIASHEYTGEMVHVYEDFTSSFENVDFLANHNYTIEITQINGAAPHDSTIRSQNIALNPAPLAGNNLDVLVHTDNFPGEITWDIRDEDDNIVLSGGPYQLGDGNEGMGGPDALAIKHNTLSIPSGVAECFTINMYDGYGDGWSYGMGQVEPGIEIVSGGQQVAYYKAGNFGDALQEKYAFRTSGSLSNNVLQTNKTVIYPNPSHGVFHFSVNEPVSVSVSDISGKLVFPGTKINNGGSIDLSVLQKGVYFAKIEDAAGNISFEKIVIQ